MAKTDHISVTSTRVIDYPCEWTDHTGPFGGAYQWAMDNMLPNTEVIGMRVAVNSHRRTECFKFRLIRGNDGEVRGKMELEQGLVATIRGGYLGVVARGEDWNTRYVLVADADGTLTWKLEWDWIVHYEKLSKATPHLAMAAISKCSETINMLSRNLRRNWCREVFGLPFDALKRHRMLSHYVSGLSTEQHCRMYEHLLNEYGEAINAHQRQTVGFEQTFTSEDMDRLCQASRIILGR